MLCFIYLYSFETFPETCDPSWLAGSPLGSGNEIVGEHDLLRPGLFCRTADEFVRR